MRGAAAALPQACWLAALHWPCTTARAAVWLPDLELQNAVEAAAEYSIDRAAQESLQGLAWSRLLSGMAPPRRHNKNNYITQQELYQNRRRRMSLCVHGVVHRVAEVAPRAHTRTQNLARLSLRRIVKKRESRHQQKKTPARCAPVFAFDILSQTRSVEANHLPHDTRLKKRPPPFPPSQPPHTPSPARPHASAAEPRRASAASGARASAQHRPTSA